MSLAISPSGLTGPYFASLVPAGSSVDQRASAKLTSYRQSESISDSLELSSASREREALKIKAKARLRVDEDGGITAKANVKLKYKYDFISDDGTKISVRVKANLNFKQKVDGDDSFTKVRFTAKASISTIQQNVSDAAGALQNSNGIPEGASEAISRALELFEGVTNAASETFSAGDPPDADQLISGIVEAFNAFATDVLQNALLGIGEPATEPALEAPATDDPQVVEPLPAPVAAPTPAPIPVVNPTPAPTPVIESPVVEAADVEDPQAETPVVEATESDDRDDEVVEVVEDDAPQATEPAVPAEQPETSAVENANRVLVQLRAQVVQSLVQLVDRFGGEANDQISGGTFYQSTTKLSLRVRFDQQQYANQVEQPNVDLLG